MEEPVRLVQARKHVYDVIYSCSGSKDSASSILGMYENLSSCLCDQDSVLIMGMLCSISRR